MNQNIYQHKILFSNQEENSFQNPNKPDENRDISGF